MNKKYNQKLQVKSVKKITGLPHLNLFQTEYTDRAGTDKKWIFASRCPDSRQMDEYRKGADAVVIVPLHTETGKIVIIREYRVALQGFQYGFPAGLRDPGETDAQTAARELHEETGLELIRILRKSPAVFSSSGLTDESVCIVFAECGGRTDTVGNEASEMIEVLLLSREEAARLLADTSLMFDVKTWLVLERFAAAGRI